MDIVEKSFSYKDLLNRQLVLGQTRWMCRYGTLGEGHENITPAHRYFQAVREAYGLACSIKRAKAMSLRCQADLLDAKDKLQTVGTDAVAKLRAQSTLELAEISVTENEVTTQDMLRQLDEYDAIIGELKPEIEAKYPLGIEQASPDMWKDRFQYKMERRLPLNTIPLPEKDKQQLLDNFLEQYGPVKKLGAINV